MFFLFGMISFVTGLQNPFAIIVKEQFGVTNLMSQLGNAANFIAYACMGLPAGILLKKYGYKVTSLLAVGIGLMGVCITFYSGVAVNFWIYLTGAFISGFSMCMLNAIVNPMLNTIGGGGDRGNQLVQFGSSVNSLCATIVPVLLGYLIGTISRDTQIADANPALYIAMTTFTIAFVVILFTRIPEPELQSATTDTNDESLLEGLKKTLQYRHFVLGAVALFLYVGVEVSIANITNLYLTSSKIAILPSVSGTIVGMYWFFMLCGRLLGGILGGRVSPKAMLTCVASVAILFLGLGMLLGNSANIGFPTFNNFHFVLCDIPLGVMFFVLCGLCTSVMWGCIFNLSIEHLGKRTGMASGLFMIMVCGGGVLPLIQSLLADKIGFIVSYIVPLAAIAYILWFALIGCRVQRTEL